MDPQWYGQVAVQYSESPGVLLPPMRRHVRINYRLIKKTTNTISNITSHSASPETITLTLPFKGDLKD